MPGSLRTYPQWMSRPHVVLHGLLAHVVGAPGGTFPSTTPFKPPMSMPSSIVVVEDRGFERHLEQELPALVFPSG